MKESAVTSHVRLEAADHGCWLGRNNSGAFKNEAGRLVRFGLGGFKKSDEMKSSDWIGYTPTLIMPHHIGRIMAVFTAIEVKQSDWAYNPADERSLHQWNFIDMIEKAGGNAGFATNTEDFKRIIKL